VRPPASTLFCRLGFGMRLCALVEAGDSEAIDVFLRAEEAQRALEDCLRDEPDWRGLLRVEEIELSATSECANSGFHNEACALQPSRSSSPHW